MHANPDILDGNAISGRRRGEGEGGQIPRWWIRLKNGLLEGDPEHPAKRIDDGGRPHSPAAQALCDFLITGEEAPLSSPPTSNSKSASFHIAPRFSYFFSAYIVVGTRPRASSFLPLEGEGRRVNFSLLPLPRKRELHPQTTISAMLIPDHRREIMFDGNRLGRDSIALLL